MKLSKIPTALRLHRNLGKALGMLDELDVLKAKHAEAGRELEAMESDVAAGRVGASLAAAVRALRAAHDRRAIELATATTL